MRYKEKEFRFSCRLVNGKITGLDKEQFSKEIALLNTDEEPETDIEIVVRKKRKYKSKKQLGYIFDGIIPIIQECFYEKLGEYWESEDVYFWLKQNFSSKPLINKDTGEVIVNPFTEKVMVTTQGLSEMNTLEASNFIEAIRKFCMEAFDVIVPTPDEWKQIEDVRKQSEERKKNLKVVRKDKKSNVNFT